MHRHYSAPEAAAEAAAEAGAAVTILVIEHTHDFPLRQTLEAGSCSELLVFI